MPIRVFTRGSLPSIVRTHFPLHPAEQALGHVRRVDDRDGFCVEVGAPGIKVEGSHHRYALIHHHALRMQRHRPAVSGLDWAIHELGLSRHSGFALEQLHTCVEQPLPTALVSRKCEEVIGGGQAVGENSNRNAALYGGAKHGLAAIRGDQVGGLDHDRVRRFVDQGDQGIR